MSIFHLSDMGDRVEELVTLPKEPVGGTLTYPWPSVGENQHIELVAERERQYKFHLDLRECNRHSSLILSADEFPDRKASIQTRQSSHVLMRIDFTTDSEAITHRNPDGTILKGTHILFAIDGFRDTIAVSLDQQDIVRLGKGTLSLGSLVPAFMDANAITKRLTIRVPLDGV